MVSRRLIRVKAYQVLFAYYNSNSDNVANLKKEVLFSINKTYELYHKVILLLVDIRNKQEVKFEKAKKKNLATPEDLNPNTKFLDNPVFVQIENTQVFNDYIERNKVSWNNHPEYIVKLLKQLEESEFYNKYLNVITDYKADKNILLDILQELILESDDFIELLEEDSVYWNDEIEFVIDLIIKTFKKLKESSKEIKIKPLYKSTNDKTYATDLVAKTVLHYKENTELINKYIKNWDSERLAFSDVLLMNMALIELQEFNDIPIKVTLNEYIEIAKFYSTKQSGNFINGTLDTIVKDLKKQDKIKKIGLGLKVSS